MNKALCVQYLLSVVICMMGGFRGVIKPTKRQQLFHEICVSMNIVLVLEDRQGVYDRPGVSTHVWMQQQTSDNSNAK